MIRVVVDDLAATSADAIVRPATIRLAPATAIAERLDRAGGPAFQRALELRADLAVGAAVVTAGGALPAEFVIHAVIAADPATVTPAGLARAWLSVLERAKEWQFAHLAAPPLHPGSADVRLTEVAEGMISVLKTREDPGAFPTSVSLVVDSDDHRALFTAALRTSAPFRP